MLRGIPELFAYTARLVKACPHRSSNAIVAYHLLSDVVNAANHALYHYLTLTLEEEFLKNSHYGSPYQKWAIVNNDNFRDFDNKVRSLVSVVERIYTEFDEPSELYPYGADSYGSRARNSGDWFTKIRHYYAGCVIDTEEPKLTLSELNFRGWISTAGVLFSPKRPSLLERKYFIMKYDEPLANLFEQRYFKKSEISIHDRTILKELLKEGQENVKRMKSSLERFGGWLRRNYTINDVCKSHINDTSNYKLYRVHLRKMDNDVINVADKFQK